MQHRPFSYPHGLTVASAPLDVPFNLTLGDRFQIGGIAGSARTDR